MNGILILDRNVGDVRAAINRELGWMVGGTGLATLVLVGAIATVFRFVVLRRLQRFESTARQIASGDLERRLPDEGSDTISWLAREFNAMADSVTGLVGEVRSQRERLETVINSIDDGIVVLDTTRTVIAANDAFLARTGGRRETVLGSLLPGPRLAGLLGRAVPGVRLPPVGPAAGPALRTYGRRRQRAVGGDPCVADLGRERPHQPRGRSLARHFRPPRRRGLPGRVAQAGVARPARLRLLARVEHAARHRPHLRRGHFAGRPLRRVGRGRDTADRRKRRHRSRANPALPRRHAALPADGPRTILSRRHRGSGERRVGGHTAGRADRTRVRRDAHRVAARRRSAHSRRRGVVAARASSTCCSTPSRPARAAA